MATRATRLGHTSFFIGATGRRSRCSTGSSLAPGLRGRRCAGRGRGPPAGRGDAPAARLFFAIGMFGLARVRAVAPAGGPHRGGTASSPATPRAANTRSGCWRSMVLLTWRLDNSRFGLQRWPSARTRTGQALGTRPLAWAGLCSRLPPRRLEWPYAVYLSPSTRPAFSPATELTTIAMVLFGGMGTSWDPGGAAVLSMPTRGSGRAFRRSTWAWGRHRGRVAMPRGVMAVAMRRGWLPHGAAPAVVGGAPGGGGGLGGRAPVALVEGVAKRFGGVMASTALPAP